MAAGVVFHLAKLLANERVLVQKAPISLELENRSQFNCSLIDGDRLERNGDNDLSFCMLGEGDRRLEDSFPRLAIGNGKRVQY